MSEVDVVAGANGIIGAAIVRRLLAQGQTTVVGVGRTPVSSTNPRLQWCTADLHEDSSIQKIEAAVAGRKVRLVVQATRPDTPEVALDAVDPEQLARAVDLKAGGLLRLFRAVDLGLRRGSCIVALGGRYGREPDPRAPAAGVANAALENLALQLAEQLRQHHVAVHVVAPARVDSRRTPVSDAPVSDRITPDDVARVVARLVGHGPRTATGCVLALGWLSAGHRGVSDIERTLREGIAP